ncbi:MULTISPECIES: TrmB family transcriptional regulator [unclassified Haloferax]|uniref:TrmB family transcriptional regulator n=1 Tax=unclassified Haloferax TaxID=2625095 RepID=UPI002876295C|nr:MULTISPECIES: TrmB family transcriptional regulator [unclassified Haloferax]MDS0240129.1 TrmB family transcriptional regulator [Haloferax sp. S2CR25]MDS0443250.1 TrmB family transcriptional regulator [Haloferax sp. S2CR25-2]
MDTAELRTALRNAGLSQYQAEAYVALLQLGAASATELADACAVPTARIYDVLRDLEAKGYIETYEQDSLHARACDPKSVMEDLKNRAVQLDEAAEEIETRWQQPAVDRHMLSIVKRFETVFSRAEEMIREADGEVQLSVTPEQFDELKPALAEAYENGALVKIVLHPDRTDELEPVAQREYRGVATEVRHRTLPTPFVAIVDRTGACFAPHDNSVNQYGVLVDDYTLAYVFHWYFQTALWEVWDVVYDAQTDEPPIVYSDIRHFVQDAEPLVRDGNRIVAHIKGYETDERDPIEFTGEVTDVYYTAVSTPTDTLSFSELAGQVCLTVEADGETYTVGGWGAVLEDVEANRITIESISGTPDG